MRLQFIFDWNHKWWIMKNGFSNKLRCFTWLKYVRNHCCCFDCPNMWTCHSLILKNRKINISEFSANMHRVCLSVHLASIFLSQFFFLYDLAPHYNKFNNYIVTHVQKRVAYKQAHHNKLSCIYSFVSFCDCFINLWQSNHKMECLFRDLWFEY